MHPASARGRRSPFAAIAALAVVGMATPSPAQLRRPTDDRVARAQALVEAGQPGAAIPLLERALSERPRQALPIRLVLGGALVDAGRFAEAVPHLAAAYAGRAHVERAAFDLARAHQGLGQRAEAVGWLRRVPDPAGLDLPSQVMAGRLALDLAAPDVAELFLKPAVVRAPVSGDVRGLYALALARLGRRDEAITHLEAGCAAEPRNAQLWLNLAVLYAGAGRYGEARARAERAIQVQPDFPAARRFLQALP